MKYVLNNFILESYDETNPSHLKLKNNIIDMEDSSLISKDINRYIRRNIELGKTDHITATYAVIYSDEYIGLAFLNYHPKETIDNIDYDEEIEIGIGILPDFRGKGLGSQIEKELSEKLLSIHSNIDFIVARTDKDNVASIKMGQKDGFNHIKDDEYHYVRK